MKKLYTMDGPTKGGGRHNRARVSSNRDFAYDGDKKFACLLASDCAIDEDGKTIKLTVLYRIANSDNAAELMKEMDRIVECILSIVSDSFSLRILPNADDVESDRKMDGSVRVVNVYNPKEVMVGELYFLQDKYRLNTNVTRTIDIHR